MVWKIDPFASNSSRNSTALVRLPLWAIAILPLTQSTVSGWAFRRLDDPAVEYRVCPIAAEPFMDFNCGVSKSPAPAPCPCGHGTPLRQRRRFRRTPDPDVAGHTGRNN